MDIDTRSMARVKLDNLLQLIEVRPIDQPYVDITAVLIAQFLREIADSLRLEPVVVRTVSPEELEAERIILEKDLHHGH